MFRSILEGAFDAPPEQKETGAAEAHTLVAAQQQQRRRRPRATYSSVVAFVPPTAFSFAASLTQQENSAVDVSSWLSCARLAASQLAPQIPASGSAVAVCELDRDMAAWRQRLLSRRSSCRLCLLMLWPVAAVCGTTELRLVTTVPFEIIDGQILVCAKTHTVYPGIYQYRGISGIVA